MLSYQILILLFLFSLPGASARQAPVDLVPATQGLTEQTGITNEDVDKGDIVDRVYSSISLQARLFREPALTTMKKKTLQQVPKDFNSLVKLINQTTTLYAGTPATKNKQTEENIADAFHPVGDIFSYPVSTPLKTEADGKASQFADTISTLMKTLNDKKAYHSLVLEGDAISSTLENLQPVFFVSEPSRLMPPSSLTSIITIAIIVQDSAVRHLFIFR